MTAVTFPLRLPRLAFAICGWKWQNDLHEIKYSVWNVKTIMFHFFFRVLFFSENVGNAPNDNKKIPKTEKQTKMIELKN